MKPSLLILALLAALFSSCSPAKSLKQFDAYAIGYTEKMRQRVESETVIEMFGAKQTQYSSNSTDYEYRFLERLPDGIQKWEMKISRFVMQNTDVEGNEVLYDTQDPNRDTTDVKKKIFDNMIDHPMFFTTTQTGKVLSFTGSETLFEKMLKPLNSMPEMESFANTIRSTYNDETMMETIKNMWGPIPDKKLKVGDKWRESREKAGMLSLKTDYLYTLKSRNSNEAVIGIKSVTTPIQGKPAEMDMGVIKVRYDLKGKGQGSITLTQPNGVLKSSTVTINLSGDMYMDGAGMGNMKVPITTKSTVLTEKI